MKFKSFIRVAILLLLLSACSVETDRVTNSNLNPENPAVSGSVNFLKENSKSSASANSSKRELTTPDFSNNSINLNTDFKTYGTGDLRDTFTGSIEISGLTGSIIGGYIYWQGITSSSITDYSITINETEIIGESIGITGSNCWPEAYSKAFKADISDILTSTGNGTYQLSGIIGLNPNGASIIVFYDDGNNTNNRDVFIMEGNDSNVFFSGITGNPMAPADNEGWEVTFPTFEYNSGLAQLQLHVADGQSFNDGEINLNSVTIEGSGDIFNGNLGTFWDIYTKDISSNLISGSNNINIQSPINNDCLSLVLAIIDVPTFNNDDDQDGIPNEVDNCPLVFNPVQNDNDGDGMGDACDDDDDNDGILDINDNCPFTNNSGQDDYDVDSMGDACDDDDDNDGCLDGNDPIQFSNIEATVVIDDCDSGVDNRVTTTCGMTMSDMIDELEAGTYHNHGKFVQAVSALTRSWVKEGLISKLEKDAIMDCAGSANIP